jgi:hypothetical protein
MSSLTNPANAANMPKTNLPFGVVVSIFSPCPVNTLNPIFLFVRSAIAVTRCFNDIPNLSNFYTIRTSPCLRALR